MKKISLFGERTYISSPSRFTPPDWSNEMWGEGGGWTLFFRNDALDPIVADRFFRRGGESRGRLPGGAEGSGPIGRGYVVRGSKLTVLPLS